MSDDAGPDDQMLFLVADRSNVPASERPLFEELSRYDAVITIGDVEDQILVPLSHEDDALARKLVRGGWAALIGTARTAFDLSRAFADRQFYFHPQTGRMVTMQITTPLILAFCLLNAGPAFSAHLLRDIDMVIAQGAGGAVYRFDRDQRGLTVHLAEATDGDTVTGDIARPRAAPAPPDGSIDTTWVVHACDITNASQAETIHGKFPELTPDFVAAFETFQRRLCVRDLARSDAAYLKAPLTKGLEDDLLSRARDCGYWSEQAFSSFAYATLLLGRDALEDNAYFVCHPPEVSPTVALVSMTHHTRRASLRKRQLDQYGPQWEAED